MFVIIATLVAWTILLFTILWALSAVGWYLLAKLWLKEFFVPSAVHLTATIFFIAIIWAGFLLLSAFLWSRYNYYRYFKNNKRQLSPPDLKAQKLTWQESVLDTSSESIINLSPLSAFNTENVSYGESVATLENKKNRKYDTGEIDIVLKDDFLDEKGKVILSEGEIITHEKIQKIIDCGLYGKFIAAVARQFFEGGK